MSVHCNFSANGDFNFFLLTNTPSGQQRPRIVASCQQISGVGHLTAVPKSEEPRLLPSEAGSPRIIIILTVLRTECVLAYYAGDMRAAATDCRRASVPFHGRRGMRMAQQPTESRQAAEASRFPLGWIMACRARTMPLVSQPRRCLAGKGAGHRRLLCLVGRLNYSAVSSPGAGWQMGTAPKKGRERPGRGGQEGRGEPPPSYRPIALTHPHPSSGLTQVPI